MRQHGFGDGVGEAPGPADDGHILNGLLDVDPGVAEDPPPVCRHPGVQPVQLVVVVHDDQGVLLTNRLGLKSSNETLPGTI